MAKNRILLVDDDPRILKSLKPALVKKGYEVTTAESGADAIGFLNKATFDLVITDLVMENIDGFQVLKTVKDLEKETMVMIMTGYGELKMAIDCLRLGADEYMLKPFEPEDLFFRLDKCFEKLEAKKKLQQAEESLKESEKRYRFLAESMADVVWTLDLEFKTTYVSPSIEKILGFTPEERKMQTLEEMITPDSVQRILEIFGEEFQRDKKQDTDKDRYLTVETEYYHAKGHTVWLENSVKAIRDEEGAIIGIYGSSRDITSRKQAEEALRESEKRFRSIVENAEAGYFFVDKEGIIREVNDAWVRMYKYTSADEIIGKHFLAVQKGEDLAKAKEYVSGLLHGDSNCSTGDFERQCKNGSIGYHTISAGSVLQSGEVVGIEGFIIDTTERKHVEQEREKLIGELKEAIDNIKILEGMLPICASCKKIRDDKGYWNHIESYIEKHTDALFSHGICPECAEQLYGDTKWYKKRHPEEKP
ncbi:PAS domain S-box protein [bacterium]|nr:PAS domain S-box protein [bacterium]